MKNKTGFLGEKESQIGIDGVPDGQYRSLLADSLSVLIHLRTKNKTRRRVEEFLNSCRYSQLQNRQVNIYKDSISLLRAISKNEVYIHSFGKLSMSDLSQALNIYEKFAGELDN